MKIRVSGYGFFNREVEQLVSSSGSLPEGRRFESGPRYEENILCLLIGNQGLNVA